MIFCEWTAKCHPAGAEILAQTYRPTVVTFPAFMWPDVFVLIHSLDHGVYRWFGAFASLVPCGGTIHRFLLLPPQFAAILRNGISCWPDLYFSHVIVQECVPEGQNTHWDSEILPLGTLINRKKDKFVEAAVTSCLWRVSQCMADI